MNHKHYSLEVMQAVRQHRGLDENDTSQDEQIRTLPVWEILDHYLRWEGIIGYTEIIRAIVEDSQD